MIASLLFIQASTGPVHHILYKKTKAPTTWGIVHRWLGRVLMVLGAIEVGLGLQISRHKEKWIIAYSVLVSLFFGAWLIVSLRLYYSKRNQGSSGYESSGADILDLEEREKQSEDNSRVGIA